MADRIAEHPILGVQEKGKSVTFQFDGQEIEGYEGEPIAAALKAAGVMVHRYTAKEHKPRGIFCAIGGDDTIRLLPYIDFDIIRNNPKIFMGYSDTTVNHLMMNKAGLVSYYGPCIITEFGEYVKIPDYTKKAVEDVLFNDSEDYEILPSEEWSDDFVNWDEKNINIAKKLKKEEHSYEVLQGGGEVVGKVLGGCIDVFPMVIGTKIWPSIEEWKDKILLLETSEENPSPDLVTYYLRNLGAQGIFEVIKGIIVGKPNGEIYYEEYKTAIRTVLKEYKKEDLPVLYNINIGHAFPIGVMPLGIDIRVNYDTKSLVFDESATKDHSLRLKR